MKVKKGYKSKLTGKPKKYLNLLELVVEKTTMVKFKSTVHNCAGNFGSISELGRQTTDFRANAKDILSEQPTTNVHLVTNIKNAVTRNISSCIAHTCPIEP